jgi:glucokinase
MPSPADPNPMPLPFAAPARGVPARPWLLADIGGTNARFGWLDASQPGVGHVATLPAVGHAGPAEAAAEYLAGLARTLGPAFRRLCRGHRGGR